MREKDLFKIYSQRCAGWLLFNKMKLIETRNNKKDTRYKIFIFKKTPELIRLKGVYEEDGIVSELVKNKK